MRKEMNAGKEEGLLLDLEGCLVQVEASKEWFAGGYCHLPGPIAMAASSKELVHRGVP